MNTSLEPVSPAPRPPLGGMGIPIILFALAVWSWDSVVILPIKLLTVFFHELSHGLAAILTGGKMLKISLTTDEGGLCTTQGGIHWIILTAGYLGSLLWGSALLLLAAKTRFDRAIVTGLGILLVAISLGYGGNATGIAFGIGFGAAMIAFAHYFGEIACDQLLRFIGLVSSFYVILDIKSDLIDRNVPMSDAYVLAEKFLLPGWVVGIVWFVIALAITYKVIMATLESDLPVPPASSGNLPPFPFPDSRS